MLIYGHELIDFSFFRLIQNISEIENQKDEILFFEYDKAMIEKAKQMQCDFALKVRDETQAVIANAAGAKFIIVPKNKAKSIQNLAEYYLFDAKIAILIDSEDKIIDAIEDKIDAVILPNAIK